MYPSKGTGAYGQQQYSGQQAYGQIPGAADVGTQHALASRQSMMGATQEADLSGYRAHSAQGAQYGGPYAAVYGSAALTSAHQAGGVGGKGAASSGIPSRYPSALPESSKLPAAALGSNLGMNSDDYVSASSRGYAQKGDPYSAVKSSDYSSIDRRHYGDQAAYHGRDLQNDPARRYADSVPIGQQHQTDVHDHMDHASLLRQQQILKAQSLSGSDMRQAEYLAARAAPIHHGSQEYSSYGGRMDVDPRSLPILGNPPYGGQHAASILGGVLRRNVDDLYTQASSNSAYGVGLPPGRDYVSGKGLHGQSLESDYQALPRGHPSLGVSIADERKDDRSAYRRELERDEERRRELIREKEKEREREDRERQRERERERERLLERRERERERDRRRERTPPRSRDRRGSSLLKDERTPRRTSPRRASPRRVSPRRVSPRRASPPPRRVSPRREAVHRHRSPVKEKKREYMCKVFPFCLVEAERDYSSLNKRYPRLFISPECSKVVLHWPKQSLHLSLHTSVSFEHEYVEVDNKGDEKALVSSDELSRMKHGNTVWNAKVILMSGMNSGALNEMCSYKSSDEKIIHFSNILRFAILKKGHSFEAIGGPWNEAIDGGDPSVEDSSLIQTVRRNLKDITQLDLQNCQHWNRFLEIHYDRIGEDGLFSHKEITVIFVPDLSECLPSLDTWRSLWLAHKKDVAERERQLAAKAKKSAEKKESGQEKVTAEGSAGKGTKLAKTGFVDTIPEEETDKVKVDDTKDSSKESNKKSAVDQEGKGHLPNEKSTEENAKEAGKEGKSDGKKITDGANADLTADKQKTVKRRIVKKVVKVKVAGKKATEAIVEDSAAKLDDKVDVKDDGDQQSKQEVVVKEEDKAGLANVKKFIRKKVVKKVPAGKSTQKVENTDSSANQTEKKPEIEKENQDEKLIKKEPDEAATPQETGVKTTGKKKIIRRVIKRKVSLTEEKNASAIKEVGDADDSVASQKASKGENTDKVGKNADDGAVGTNNSKYKVISDEAKTLSEKKEMIEKESKKKNKSNEQNSKSGKSVAKSSAEPEVAKDKDSKKDDHGSKKERTKDEKENKSKDAKHDPKQKSLKGMEKGKSEEPPQHPGLFLQTKRSKGSKVRSMSLSLDGLLDYNDKDIEESTFELSVFAESLNELLQYQMGCRLLSFLEKLRKRFVIKKNQRKRQRDEKSEKQNVDNSLKRPKVADESAGKNESPKSGKKDTPEKSRDEVMVEAGPAAEQEPKMETKSDDDNDDVEDPDENMLDDDNENENGDEEEEDPEEIIEDDQEMKDVALSKDGVQEQDENAAKTDDLKAKTENVTVEEDNGNKTASNNNIEPMDEKSDKERKEDDKRSRTENSDSVKDEVVDKEVLQAFRYFDHNRVGYIKVEDLRCLLHNLGNFISHRDVKELVQSALFESNTARDNRIFYKKLVKLTDL